MSEVKTGAKGIHQLSIIDGSVASTRIFQGELIGDLQCNKRLCLQIIIYPDFWSGDK